MVFSRSMQTMATEESKQKYSCRSCNTSIDDYKFLYFNSNRFYSYYKRVVRSMEKYVFNKEIGSGSFGKVFLIESRQTGIQYVLKQIDLNKIDNKQVKSASKEVDVLSKLKHSHIVRYKESFEVGDRLNIVMEYCENGDLHRKIKEKRAKNEFFTDCEILDYFVQITFALDYIHRQKILHRDLKTKNIFLTKGNLIKIGDFGVAKILENSFELASTCIGSPYYISPEIYENKPYNKKSDIWALGCVLYELSTLRYAFIAKNVKTLLAKISTGTFNPLPANINSTIRSLLINLLKPNPKDRPTASEILEKPFLRKFLLKYSSDRGCNLRHKRSNSGENIKLKSEVKFLSASCTRLNDITKKNKFKEITAPETKYKLPVFRSSLKKSQTLCIDRRSNARRTDKGPVLQKTDKEKENLDIAKLIRLSKVDSEYYNLIAECSGRDSKRGRESVGSAEEASGTKSENEKVSNGDATYVLENCPGVERCGLAEDDDSPECRRRWMANTFEKNQLIAILNEAELIDVTLVRAPKMAASDCEYSNVTVDDLLKLDPAEMAGEVLQPMKIDEITVKADTDYSTVLTREIQRIKREFDAKNGAFDLDDLITLTESAKEVLRRIREMIRSETGRENWTENESQSVFFDLELRRMLLEKAVGFNTFLMAYRKMMDLLNGSFQNEAEGKVSASDSATDSQSHTQKHKDAAKIWISIMNEFGSRRELAIDMWECAIWDCVHYM